MSTMQLLWNLKISEKNKKTIDNSSYVKSSEKI